jgi:antitoxin ParD1/3/4
MRLVRLARTWHWRELPIGAVTAMPTRNINLTPEHDAFVEKVVEAGEHQNASEAIRDAIRALQQRRREDALELELLRAQLHAGVASLERGDFIELDEAELASFLRAPSRSRKKRAR